MRQIVESCKHVEYKSGNYEQLSTCEGITFLKFFSCSDSDDQMFVEVAYFWVTTRPLFFPAPVQFLSAFQGIEALQIDEMSGFSSFVRRPTSIDLS